MLKSIILIFLVITIISGCSSTDLLTQISGKEWNVTSLLGKTLTGSEKPPTINFGDNGKIFGTTGCNNFVGNFKLSGSSLSLDPGALTKMFCPDSPETEFLSAIKQVTNIKMENGTLNLLNGTHSVITLIPGSK